MVTVHIPPSLHKFTNDQRVVEISAVNVREVVEQLEQHFPGVQDRLCSAGNLKPEINVAINSRIGGIGLLEATPDGCEVHFIPAISGG